MTKQKIGVNLYNIVSRAVEEGVAYGIHRGYKHTDGEPPEGLAEAVETAVLTELCSVLDFTDPDWTPEGEP